MTIMRSRWRGATVLLAALVLLGTACRTGDGPAAGGGGAGGAELRVGPGVTANEISLGVLTDSTGQFASLGKAIVQGNQLFWDDQNAKGGVCNRQVKLVVKDHGYNVQNAVTAYAEVKDSVLALQQSLGSPMTTQLIPNINEDKMLASGTTWASNLLDSPYIIVNGTTYELEIMNGIDYLMREMGLKPGDPLGYIYQEGAYGEDGFRGGKIMTDKHKFRLIEQKIKGTDRDMTAQVEAIKASGARFIVMTSGPTQSASVASVARATGYDVTILSSNPGFDPSLLAGPAKDALEANFLLVGSAAVFSSDAPGPSRVRDAFARKFPNEPANAGVPFGYGQAQVFYEILNRACDNKDMTRDGLLRSFQSLTAVDTQGLLPKLDFSRPGESPSREVYVARPDSRERGGLKQFTQFFASEDAKVFKRK